MNIHASNVKAYIVFGESYQIDRSGGTYNFRKLQGMNGEIESIREYIEISKFEQSMQGTNFYRTRVINGTKEQM